MATGYNGENLVSTLGSPFLIESSSFLQVTSTTIISPTGLKFSEIQPGTAELAALEHLEKWEKCYEHSSAFIFGWIFIILAGDKENHKSLDEIEFLPDHQ